MLIKYAVENYRSINEKVTLKLEQSSAIKDFKENTIDTGVENLPFLLRSLAIYGTNGSGKTNILKSLGFLIGYITTGATSYNPGELIEWIEPFRLNKDSSAKPTHFEIDFIIEKIRYQYSVSLNNERIFHECLSAYPNQIKQTWFERSFSAHSDGYEWKFGPNFKGERESIKNRTLENILFLSKAAQENHELIRPIVAFFADHIYVSPNSDNDAAHTYKLFGQPGGTEKVLRFLKAADLDIDRINVESKEMTMEEIPDFFSEEMRQRLKKEIPRRFETKSLHKIPGSEEYVEFDFSTAESLGAKKLFNLSGLIIKTLDDGGVLFIDELEKSLHCKLVIFIIDLFNSRATNPKGAQLIFTTHSPSLLESAKILKGNKIRRDQIWFTNKTTFKNTMLYSLVDVSKVIDGAKPVRRGEDLMKGFFEGRFYTPPKIDPQLTLFEEVE